MVEELKNKLQDVKVENHQLEKNWLPLEMI
jgi:hypothetical protein